MSIFFVFVNITFSLVFYTLFAFTYNLIGLKKPSKKVVSTLLKVQKTTSSEIFRLT